MVENFPKINVIDTLRSSNTRRKQAENHLQAAPILQVEKLTILCQHFLGTKNFGYISPFSAMGINQTCLPTREKE